MLFVWACIVVVVGCVLFAFASAQRPTGESERPATPGRHDWLKILSFGVMILSAYVLLACFAGTPKNSRLYGMITMAICQGNDNRGT